MEKLGSSLMLWSNSRAACILWCLNHWNPSKGTKMCHFPRKTLFQACANSIHKTIVELMNVSELWDLNEKRVDELLYLLVYVWSPGSERWPR